MTRRSISSLLCNCILSGGLLLTMQAGCGFDRLQPQLPDLVDGLSLQQLGDIQSDERLTDTQKREAIRTAAGIPDTAAGDRLVDFLLNFDVP